MLVKGVADELWERDDREHFLVVLSTSMTGRRISAPDGEAQGRTPWM